MKFPKSLISRLYFSYACEFEINQHQFLYEALEEPTYSLTSSGDDYSSCILKATTLWEILHMSLRKLFSLERPSDLFFTCGRWLHNHHL